MRNVYYAALSCLIVAAVLSVCYNLFVHRLRFVPGPRRHAISRIPYIYATLTGQLPFLLHRLHEKYGPVVRTAPNEVSFIDQGALRTLHTHKNAVTSHIFPKNYDAWSETSNYFANTIFLTGKDDDHARMRKVFGAAFSEQMLREHESTIAKAVDCFVEQLREDFASSQDAPGHLFTVDLNKRLHWLAFDIASEFVFGLNFDCVRSPVYRTWLHKLSCTWTFIAIISSLKQLVAISAQLLRPFGLLQSRVDALSLLDSRSEELMDKSALKPTLLSVGRMCVKDDKITRQEPGTITRLELIANVSLFTVAGTDTVATVMPSVVFLLLSHPNAMECLLRELRNIPQEKDITYQRLSEIHYLTACIQEAMRLHPPVPEGLPRVVPGVGAEICGHWVPPGVSILSDLGALSLD